ncbi:response regulator transcription factor [Nonomuraea sp. FMUSA5-5]|uniref:Response regulator transcription factor n=1 Tax=Nonomuraea composti TaxID=2720023 RepID=A0ABX1B7H7_9ACTN|nr:response regulator transcription factor [Nonomuraea sp. FMUSA5-5]
MHPHGEHGRRSRPAAALAPPHRVPHRAGRTDERHQARGPHRRHALHPAPGPRAAHHPHERPVPRHTAPHRRRGHGTDRITRTGQSPGGHPARRPHRRRRLAAARHASPRRGGRVTRPPLRIVLADDQAVVRTALRMVIERRADLRVVSEAADGAQAVAAAFEHRPDVVVMDVRMPGMTGVDATRAITRQWPHADPHPQVLILTTFDLDEYVHAALRAGAAGFLLKNSRPDQLAEAIRTVAEGESILSPSTTRRLIETFTCSAVAGPGATTGEADLVDRLTERERDVLILLAKGHTNPEIAEALGLTETSVRSRVNRILTRLRLDNRVQAALAAYRAGLIPDEEL